MLIIGLVTVIYHLGTLNPLDPIFNQLFHTGALGNGGSTIFLIICGYWAIKVWDSYPLRERSTFLSLPADRSYHQLLHIAAGVLILVSVITVSWMAGAVFIEVVAPGRSWFTAPGYAGGAWPISLFGILNAYLYGSILALLFRKPEIWFVIIAPGFLFLLDLLFPQSGTGLLNRVVETVFWPPTGVFAGFGLPAIDPVTRALDVLPNFGVVLMWTVIWTAGVFLSTRIHREA
jgi:hypothetical protein